VGIKVENRRISKLMFLAEGLNVVLDDGEEMYMRLLVHMPHSVPAGSDLIPSLSFEMVDSPIGQMMKRSEPFGTTSIRGVFGCGDAGTFMKHTTQAMAQDE
jgi:hypothetical protein